MKCTWVSTDNHGGSIVVQSITVETNLIAVHIYTAALELCQFQVQACTDGSHLSSSFGDKAHSDVQFPKAEVSKARLKVSGFREV